MLNIGSNDSNIISNVLSGSNNNSVTQNAVKPLVNSSKDKAKEQVVPSLQQKSIEK